MGELWSSETGKIPLHKNTRPAMPSADGQAPCLQFRRERQQSVTPSMHHLCFWFTSHYVINHSVTPSLYHQSLSHSSYLHCSLLSLFLSSTPSTLTLGSTFDWFSRPLDIFIVCVTMYLRHTIRHQAPFCIGILVGLLKLLARNDPVDDPL